LKKLIIGLFLAWMSYVFLTAGINTFCDCKENLDLTNIWSNE